MVDICFIIDKNYLHYIEILFDKLDYYKVIFLENIDDEAQIILNSKLVITIHSFNKRVLSLLKELKGKVKTLTIQDGIIEYKSSNHKFQGNYRFQPLYSDYIAVFGEASKNILLGYGIDEEQIFVIGSPRFDIIKPSSTKEYLLITMANRPGYGLENCIKYYKLMEDLLIFLESSNVNFRLRLSRGVSNIGQESIYKIFNKPSDILIKYFNHPPSSIPLYNELEKDYALITTPSTTSLEGMLYQIPVVHLVSDTVPINLQTVWNINIKEHFNDIIFQLKKPSKFKLLNQNVILRYNISNMNNSTYKLIKLIENLI